ncbi:hypothetical protein CO054_00085 [Candidatus Shapirobacteria bacterium CG_4_9_14_0_2_um_filter_39_11]|uniref:Glycosyl transferase family 1 domain-containing protein n=1 Tax=Candidatus Shapirobacteria bacterium CG_4_9_14_0_2_um_filter_39_11 TaxID=1974478 RepID=A0A2M8ETL5_9BACT|nr:MAG: hypothetical protein CO054_00085 [Candidatus Shapirobacteria bacterium CG_4_9_14_0_2_um_filter_39_11]
MKIFLLIAEHGYSFVNQAYSLVKGLSILGVENKIERVHHSSVPAQKINSFQPDFIIGMGSWHSYKLIVEAPNKLGFRTIPWLVSDGKISRYIGGLNKLPLILTPSQHCRQIFIRDGINEKIIKVLPEAVDPDFWHELSEKDLTEFLRLISISKQSLLLPINFDLLKLHQEKVPILFTTGGDATSKGAQEVITALAEVNKKINGRPWMYIIKTWPSINSFQDSAKELKLAKKFGILENIRYIVGEFSQEFIRGLMTLCDIYIAPSRSEGFGLPLVEAQMCGKPVISIEATSTREIIEHGETGFLAKANFDEGYPRAEIKDLSRFIEMLLTDKQLRSKIGRSAKAHAVEKFNPKTIAQQMLSLINQTNEN